MNRNKEGFTLSELLIALGVIGVLSAILLPIIFNMIPDKNIIMARRAFNSAQAAVYDLINDPSCYPDMTRLTENPKVGFDDGTGHTKCRKWGISATNNKEDKFAVLFADKLSVSVSGANANFTTKDGIKWKISKDASGGFKDNDSNSYVNLIIDVNGDNAPNSETEDQFKIKVKANGQMEIVEEWAKEAVKVDSGFVQ